MRSMFWLAAGGSLCMLAILGIIQITIVGVVQIIKVTQQRKNVKGIAYWYCILLSFIFGIGIAAFCNGLAMMFKVR